MNYKQEYSDILIVYYYYGGIYIYIYLDILMTRVQKQLCKNFSE